MFQHTAARRRLGNKMPKMNHAILFQHTAARRRLEKQLEQQKHVTNVSTHSRPKAAGSTFGEDRYKSAMFQHTAARRRLGFNCVLSGAIYLFQHTAARRRLVFLRYVFSVISIVSTHSRPKAAGPLWRSKQYDVVRFNTQPPEGGWPTLKQKTENEAYVSTHSRPKAAGNRRWS